MKPGDRVRLSLYMRRLLCRGSDDQQSHLLAVQRQTGTVVGADVFNNTTVRWDDPTGSKWHDRDPSYGTGQLTVCQ